MDAQTSFDLFAHFDRPAKVVEAHTVPTRGIRWVLIWAAALGVLFVAASVLIEFIYCLTAEHTLVRAARAGAQIGALCEAIHRRDGLAAVRRILGVLALVKQRGPVVVEAACATALELGVADYRFVRRYLERQPGVPLTLRQVDPLIRDLTHYRDVIARLTTGATP